MATKVHGESTPCATICNHWSYIGIGWQLGIESCVLSCLDAMECYDRANLKTCLNLDARAYEFIAAMFPEVAERLRTHLAQGSVELVGGTYGQPMGTTIGGESNIRQIVVGRETIRKAFGYEVVTFLEEEEFSHPQLPQLLNAAGFRYASLAQLDTWGRAGVPIIDLHALRWEGKDGSTIPATPKNSLFLCMIGRDAGTLAELMRSDNYRRIGRHGPPLIIHWEEFGWESPEEPAYLTAPDRYLDFAGGLPVRYVTLTEYLDRVAASRLRTRRLVMDDWDKSLTWGLGGDQVRVLDRKTEALLLDAEIWDAAAAAFAGIARAEQLQAAWKDLLASQSHDVGLCEYSRWQGDRMAPLERLEDLHNFPWGVIGYNHLDAARRQGEAALGRSLRQLSRGIESEHRAGEHPVTLWNTSGRRRTGVVTLGLPTTLRRGATGVSVRRADGRVVPSQVTRTVHDSSGRARPAEVIFLASNLPAMGFDTYHLSLRDAGPPISSLAVDPDRLEIRNQHLRVSLDRTTGAIASLRAEPDGQEMLAAPFPRFFGTPNRNYPLLAGIPECYDSGKSRAQIDWLEVGPVRAVLRARHKWSHLTYETRVSLDASSRGVEVVTRVLAQVPPAPDVRPADIEAGYWMSLRPAFRPSTILRDYPFGVEETRRRTLHALTFVDLVSPHGGLMLIHPGTQFFRLAGGGELQNLLMREWESHFTREYGWPKYAEYRHVLIPHDPGLTNDDRHGAVSEFDHPIRATARKPSNGPLPRKLSVAEVRPPNVRLTCIRRTHQGSYELRLVEVEGCPSTVRLELGLPFSRAHVTDLLGNEIRKATCRGRTIRIGVRPWEVVTLRVC